MKQEDVIILNKEKAYNGFFKIFSYQLQHPLYQGGTIAPIHRELFHRDPAVGVLPIDPIQRKVLLVKQFRIGAYHAGLKPDVYECVAGIIEHGLSSEETLYKEGKEEAGIDLKNLTYLQQFIVTPGGSSELIDLYFGEFDSTTFKPGIFGVEEEGENIAAEIFSYEEAFSMAKNGIINDLKTAYLIKELETIELRKFAPQ